MWRYGFYLLSLIFGVWTVASALTQVQSHECAVIRRFGRILDTKPGQGLHISWPWGIDRVDLAPVGRERSIKVGFVEKKDDDDNIVPFGQMVTGDHNLVNVQASIDFRVREADVEKFVLQQPNIDAFVARAAESLLAEWIAGHTVDDVLRRGKRQLAGWLVGQMQDRLADYDLGIDIKNYGHSLRAEAFPSGSECGCNGLVNSWREKNYPLGGAMDRSNHIGGGNVLEAIHGEDQAGQR